MQEEHTPNGPENTEDLSQIADGRIVALDIGTKNIGVAVSDELRITARPLRAITRTSWKTLLVSVKQILAEFDAKALVIGLPYNFDGTESEMSADARDIHRKFTLSLSIPVYFQDERVSSYEARGRLWKQGLDNKEVMRRKDSESAAVILGDFLDRIPQPR